MYWPNTYLKFNYKMSTLSLHASFNEQVKTLSYMKLRGTYWNWVSGFKVFYSDDAKDWMGYSSNNDLDKVMLLSI